MLKIASTETSPQELTSLRKELQDALALAESYRLAAKARAEEITLLLARLKNPDQISRDRELQHLRALERRRAVRLVVFLTRPLERPYKVLKPAIGKTLRWFRRA